MLTVEVLRIVLAVLFSIMGILHFIFRKPMTKYAVDSGLLNADIAVRMSGVLLVLCSVLLFIPKYTMYSFYGFCIFLLLANLTLHKFWTKPNAKEQLSEFLHFVKNIIILLLIWHIKDLF